MVAVELADEFDVRSLAATRACAREFEQRRCELAVLGIELDVHEVLLGSDLCHAEVPVLLYVELGLQGFHLESFHALLAGADVHAVAAAEAVEGIDGLDEAQALESGAEGGDGAGFAEGACGGLCLVEQEGTYAGVGADEGAFVALYAVFFEPLGHECCHAAFFICGGSLLPCAVGTGLEVGNFEEVAVLGVDGADDLVDELGIVVGGGGGLGKVLPVGVDGEDVVFTAAVHSGIVLVYDILTFLGVALDDEFLHLLDGEVHGDNAGDTEEGALQDGVGAVAQTYFLRYAGSVDVVNGDVVLGEVLLDVVGQVLCQFVAFPDGVDAT